MKMLLALVVCSIVLFPLIAFAETAETSIALKEGYVRFSNNGKSEYEGNNIMDNTFSGGGYLRIVKDETIYRLDIDTFETGNTFSQHIPIAYEKVDFESNPIMLSIGRYFTKGLYGIAGIGILLNDMVVEQYVPSPFDYKIDNSLGLSAIIGYDFKMNKCFYSFLEGRYLYSKADVYIQGNKNHKENLSNLGMFIGIGWRF